MKWCGFVVFAGTLVGNCVDLTRGVLQYAAASGAKRLGVGFSIGMEVHMFIQ